MWNANLARLAVLAATMAVASGPAAAAERPWVELRSPHFVVVSNAGEGEGREIAWQFEQGRSVFNVLWPWARQEEDRPFVVLVARDEETLRTLAPSYWEVRGGIRPSAVYVSGAEHDFVALRVDRATRSDVRVNPYKTAFEGYADNRIVRHFGGRTPLWFREGLAEVFGNTLVREKDVQVGRVIPWHLEMLDSRVSPSTRVGGPSEDRRTRSSGLATRTLMPLSRLLTVQRDDAEVTGETANRYFAAQAWAFVHYLMFGDGGSHRGKFNQLAALLASGRAADEATAKALGDIPELSVGYREYMSGRLYQYQRVNVDVDVAKERWPARPVPPAEAAAFKARFHVAMGRAAEAREMIAAAREADPSLAAAYEVEGLLLDREGNAEGSHAALARAHQLGSTSPWVLARLGLRKASAPTPMATPTRAEADAGPSLIAACNGGDDSACGRLAPALQAACDSGDAPMCMPLAWLHMNGRGVPRDLGKAESLYARACDAGEAKACATLARIRATAEKK